MIVRRRNEMINVCKKKKKSKHSVHWAVIPFGEILGASVVHF